MNRLIEGLSIASDFIFGEVMRQPENVKPLLEAVLGKKSPRSPTSRNSRTSRMVLNCTAFDWTSPWRTTRRLHTPWRCRPAAYDLERRIRYYQSSLDRRTLEVSEHYRDLKSSYVIFICTEDYYKRGLALYKRKSVIEGAEDIVYDDGLPCVYSERKVYGA